jgi:hypothetical protein
VTPTPISYKNKIDELFDSAGKSTCDNSLGQRKKDPHRHEDVDVSAFDMSDIECHDDCSSHSDDSKVHQNEIDCKKENETLTSSREGSLSRSTASCDRDHSSSRSLSDQPNSDLDVSSDELADHAHESKKSDQL